MPVRVARLWLRTFPGVLGDKSQSEWWSPVGSSLLVYRQWKDGRDQGCLKRYWSI